VRRPRSGTDTGCWRLYTEGEEHYGGLVLAWRGNVRGVEYKKGGR
jgi:hypothetical protein